MPPASSRRRSQPPVNAAMSGDATAYVRAKTGGELARDGLRHVQVGGDDR
ncbi:hypothetical protein [Amycolatopsis sp. NBC_01286]|nr:hypothetical protein OG570_14145 [Amycolatopsis sp. NBC_01286]